MSSPSDSGAPASTAEVPPFLPDPELIEHAEGNRRERERYRQHAWRSREESLSRWAEAHGETSPTQQPSPDPPPSDESDPDLVEWERRDRDPGER